MDANQISAALNIATAAAIEAGKLITQNIDQLDRVKVAQKDRFELVSEIDVQAEETIIADLSAAYPEFNTLGEESGFNDKGSNATWIIDPIDGTHNFLHGHPHCAVSIGLKVDNEAVAGVVYDALRNELFSARKGGGAQLDNRRIRVSNVSKLAESLLCTGFPHREGQETKQWLKSFALMLPRAQTIHRTGSSVLDLAWVAAGRYDGFWAYGLKPWDIVSGAVLIREAGGMIADLSGNANVLESSSVIAGSPKVFEKMLHITKQIKAV
ncbi:MAG: inositol monophosphatase family protein [Pseudomonadota bacterium]